MDRQRQRSRRTDSSTTRRHSSPASTLGMAAVLHTRSKVTRTIRVTLHTPAASSLPLEDTPPTGTLGILVDGRRARGPRSSTEPNRRIVLCSGFHGRVDVVLGGSLFRVVTSSVAVLDHGPLLCRFSF